MRGLQAGGWLCCWWLADAG